MVFPSMDDPSGCSPLSVPPGDSSPEWIFWVDPMRFIHAAIDIHRYTKPVHRESVERDPFLGEYNINGKASWKMSQLAEGQTWLRKLHMDKIPRKQMIISMCSFFERAKSAYREKIYTLQRCFCITGQLSGAGSLRTAPTNNVLLSVCRLFGRRWRPVDGVYPPPQGQGAVGRVSDHW